MSNSKLGQKELTGISDQKMLARVDVLVTRGDDLADGKIAPETDEDFSLMLWTLLGRVRDQWTNSHKEQLDYIQLKWRGRSFAEMQVKFNKPTRHLPDSFPTYEQMIRELQVIYRQIVPLVQ